MVKLTAACLSVSLWVPMAAHAMSGQRPHLVHIVADDLGWNDLGLTNPSMRTSHIDALASGGVQLTHFYAQKECAPTRSSMMTGRLPFRYGYYQNPSDDGAVPTNYTMLPAVLKARGYKTHAIGKWHCGFRSKNNTPIGRGFDTFLGYWHWGEEYNDHVFPPYYKDAKANCRGVDFAKGSDGNLEPLLGMNGTRSTQIFLKEFSDIVAEHQANTPLYVYLAFQNVHDPYEQAPPDLLASQSPSVSPLRRNFSALVEDLDQGVGKVVDILKISGMWENTVIWFNADNGAELPFVDQSKCSPDCLTTACCGGAGNNYPLRGGKFSLFEGGIRVRSFVYSKSPLWMPAAFRGKAWSGLAHVSDIFASMASLAGAKVIANDRKGIGMGNVVDDVPTDGYNLWPSIMTGGASPRKEIVHQPLNMYWNKSCTESDTSNPFTPSCGASITVWPYKLFVGFPGDSRVVVLPNSSQQQRLREAPRDECVARPCLFNLESDPFEANDLAAREQAIVDELMRRLEQLSAPEAAPQPADALTPDPPLEACHIVETTGAWMPWVDGVARYPRVSLV